MKTLVTTLTERGQVSVPAKIRKDLRLKRGAKLVWRIVSNRECSLTIVEETAVAGAKAMLGFAGQFREMRRTSDWMAELREGEREDT